MDERIARLVAIPGVRTAAEVAEQVAGAAASSEVLPVLPGLTRLLPGTGLERGDTVAVSGSVSLLLGLVAGVTGAGGWAAVVGMPELGLVAAAELGVDLGRFALVASPVAEVIAVATALLDGVDLVVLGSPAVAVAAVSGPVARRLSARARHRGAVLVAAGPWPGAELELRAEPGLWSGLEDGPTGYLTGQIAVVYRHGRGAAARPARFTVALPHPGGEITAVPVRRDRSAEQVAALESAR
ncbi:hypothetical protein OG371_37000 [Amycolatopsis sp. NBC_01480]|nr:hypothetical protein [Amycolatopsis sp. NBC_01480]